MEFSKISIHSIASDYFGENTYIIHLADKKGCFIVDPGFESEKLADYLEKKKLKPIAVLLTHGHVDHIVGIGEIKRKWPDCAVCIGFGDGEKLVDPVKNLSAPFGLPIVVPPAEVLFRDGDSREIAGIPITVRHVPGHSAGHVVYLIECDTVPILFSGDAVFKGSIGRSDFPDGNSAQLLDSIRRQILTLPDTTVIYSGHGPKTTVGAERKHNPFLQ